MDGGDMKTIILDDDTFTVLRSALDHSVPTMEEPKPTPVPAPTKDSIISVPWTFRAGTFTTTIDPGETVSFAFVPQNTNGKLANFAVSPTDGGAYFDREHYLSDSPGEFDDDGLKVGQSDRRWFSCGGYPTDRYGRENTRYPALTPGKTYYVNVRQKDPTLTCRVNYALTPA
jgi:hypothetical protein